MAIEDAHQSGNTNLFGNYSVRDGREEIVKQQLENNKEDALNGKALEEYIQNLFDSQMLTVAEFKKFLRVSGAFWSLMKKHGNLPRIIPLTPGGNEGRILVYDIARWIERNSAFGCLVKQDDGSCVVAYDPDRKATNQCAEQETASAAI